MRTLIGFLGPLLVMGSFGIAQRQQHDSDACGFTVQGESRRATVAGADDIVPLVYVVEQPDSPIEIVSVDLQGMWLSVSNDQHREQNCAKYRVHNRSDRVIQQFDLELMVSGISGGGGSGAHSSSPLAPGDKASSAPARPPPRRAGVAGAYRRWAVAGQGPVAALAI